MGLGGSSIPKDQRVVIIGSGYGGTSLANALIKAGANVTVIDTKECFHHNVASVRTYVDKTYARIMFIPYAPTFGARYRQGRVTQIDTTTKTVSLEGSQEVIAYDILIIATGSKGPLKEWELSLEDSVKKYSLNFDVVKESNKIVIIGGGPSGVEIAAEIASVYPDKKVTVIHGGDRLIASTMPDNFNKRLTALLQQYHITVLLGEKVDNMSDLVDGVHGSYQVKTSKGNVIEADLIIKATGLTINSSAYASSLGDHMEPSGALRVNEYLQVEGFTDIFALGDCNTLETIKTAALAGKQAEHLAANIPKHMNKKSMTAWKTPMKIFGISFGREHGISVTGGGWMLPEFLMVYVKSKDLMIGRFYGEMNQTVPK